MYKLTFNELGKHKEATFNKLPTLLEIQRSLDVGISSESYETLIEQGWIVTMFARYELNKVPSIDELNEAWKDFLSVAIYEDQRFGQYFYNEYKFEVENSYNIERPYLAYQVLYAALVTTLDDVLEN